MRPPRRSSKSARRSSTASTRINPTSRRPSSGTRRAISLHSWETTTRSSPSGAGTSETFVYNDAAMTYIIAEPCIGTKDTACVDVCPVDCIHPRKDEANFADVPQLYIDPVECIDCGACVPVCPVSAIFPLDDLPENCRHRANGDEIGRAHD